MSQGVKVINNIHKGYQTITPSDTVVVPVEYSDGFLIITAGTIKFNCKDISADVTLTFAIGDWWLADLNLVYATGTTATMVGININH